MATRGLPGVRLSQEAGGARSLLRARLDRGVLLGWAVFLLAVTATLAAIGLDVHTGSDGALLYVGVASVEALIGVVLTTRLPAHPISWVIAGAALWLAVFCLSYAYAYEALVHGPGSLPGGLVAAWVDNWGWLPALALPTCALLVLMPDGRLLSRRWWPVPAVSLVGVVMATVALSVSSTFDLGTGSKIENPLGYEGGVVTAVAVIGTLSVFFGLVASLVAFGVRLRRSAGEEREQLRWVGLSIVAAVVFGAAGVVLWDKVAIAPLLPALALLALPIGIAVAVLKYRLYEIDLIVNRAIVYAVMTAGVVTTYVVVVGLVGSALSHDSDVALSLVVTGVVAVSFQPVRERVQRVVNRLLHGERDDPYEAIASLGRRLETSLPADAVLPTVVETIGETLALSYVAVTTTAPGGAAEPDEALVAYGHPGEPLLSVPLVHHGVTVGELRVAPRRGERLRVRDQVLLSDLAPQVAAAVHGVGLARELRVARDRVVEFREIERRRIRRDLHDGLGPALAGLTFTLEAVRNLTDSDLARADALLASATDQVQTMISDVRHLIDGLRPPALEKLGLSRSLDALVVREGSPERQVRLHAPSVFPPLRLEVEVAVYWIVQEALTNVRRHAFSRSCDVEVGIQPDTVTVTVTDDGCGIPRESAGIGHTMKERAADVGGSCAISLRSEGGTIVAATLPRARAERRDD